MGGSLNYRALFSSLRTATISSTRSLQGKRSGCGARVSSGELTGTGTSAMSAGRSCASSPSSSSSFPSGWRLPTDSGWSSASPASTSRLFSTNCKVAWTNTYVTREKGSESLVLESGAMVKRKLYAVKKGRQPGLYNTWKEAEEQVKGYRNAVHRSFSSKKEAETYLGWKEEEGTAVVASVEAGPADLKGSGETKAAAEKASEGEGKKARKKSPKSGRKQKDAVIATVRQSTSRVGEYHLMQFDGGARGNPGIAGAGVVLFSPEGEIIEKKSLFLGDKVTNNQAEYQALILGLQLGLDLGFRKLQVEGDSELVINQVVGHYDVNNKELKLLMKKVVEVLEQMEDIVMRHIPREENKIADELANSAMDTHL